MSYKHITSFQRNELSVLLKTRTKQKKIAKILKKHRTSVWRERQRNGNDKYSARMAKKKTEQRRIKANQRFRKIDSNERLRRYINELPRSRAARYPAAWGDLFKNQTISVAGVVFVYNFFFVL